MKYRYAQIDKDGNILSDSLLSGEVKADNMIPIEAEFNLFNKKYNLETEQFEEVEPTTPITPQPTLEEQVAQLQEQNLTLMDALATIYEELLAKEVL